VIMLANRIYNEDIKQKFLETYENEGTRNTMKYIFFAAFENEMPLEKDIYNFSLDEIGKVISSSNPKSVPVALSRGRFISQYISWAIENNLRTNTLNPLQNIDKSWYEQFIDHKLKMFISKNDVEEFAAHLVNNQDIAILHLIFNGVYGHSSSEIRNLKMTDLNRDEKSIRLYDDKKGERYIYNVDEKLFDVLEKANADSTYQSNNGNSTRQKESELVDNEYIIRPARRGRVIETERASQITIINRIKSIAEEFDMEDLTPKGIQRSGMIYMAYKMLKEEGKQELDKKHFETIGDHFNLTKITSNDGQYSYHNRSTMSEYINIENIKKLYPDF
jgi:integrase